MAERPYTDIDYRKDSIQESQRKLLTSILALRQLAKDYDAVCFSATSDSNRAESIDRMNKQIIRIASDIATYSNSIEYDKEVLERLLKERENESQQ